MKNALKCLLTAVFALWAGLAVAQLEVIELQSRSAAEVLPVLTPLVEPGGTLTGLNNQLFLRTSAKNRAEIRRALAAIDKPARRLVIQVATDRARMKGQREAEANGQVVLGSNSRVEVEGRVWDTQTQREAQAMQRVQTVDGGRAFIQIGRALPVPMRVLAVGPGGPVVSEGIVYRDIGSGFYASPRINGERVTLEITQQDEQLERGRRGSIATQRLATTVSGRLGEWIELGGTGQQADEKRGGGFSVGTGELRERRAIWLKVDAVQP